MNTSRRTWFLLLAMTVSLGAWLLASAQKSPQQAEVLFESARQREVVEGKLQEAIQLYQRIVEEFAANRPVAARAVLRMGQCYERLGQADARKAYERLVREFGDQVESVTEARARLAALAGPAVARKPETTTRLVWADADDLTGSPSSDGRLMATTDWNTGDIAIRDLATGDERRVTKTGDIAKSTVFGFNAKFSPDDKQVAYGWNTETIGGHFDLCWSAPMEPAPGSCIGRRRRGTSCRSAGRRTGSRSSRTCSCPEGTSRGGLCLSQQRTAPFGF